MCEVCENIARTVKYDHMTDLRLEDVIQALATAMAVPVKQLRGLGTLQARRNKCHDSDDLYALRSVAMFLARQYTRASLPAIGEYFGKRHHTTVLAAVRRLEDALEKDAPGVRVLVQKYIDHLDATFLPPQLSFPFVVRQREVFYA